MPTRLIGLGGAVVLGLASLLGVFDTNSAKKNVGTQGEERAASATEILKNRMAQAEARAKQEQNRPNAQSLASPSFVPTRTIRAAA